MELAKRNELKVRSRWPLMVMHRALSGDRKQYSLWKERFEKILQSHRLSRTRSAALRKVIAHGPAWKRARGFGRLGTFFVLGLAGWTTYNISLFYGQFLNFGLWPWLLFVPPLVPAAIHTKRALEDAALASMAATRGEDEGTRRRTAALAGVLHSFKAGFTGGFLLLFLQGLMSWFLTPAASLAQEVVLDATVALQYAFVMGSFTAPLGLVLGRGPLNPKELPPAPSATALLIE